jgi:hypothetical protein
VVNTGWNGGTPIREEVLERRDESVMTRNSYGAHCLNTENVAIADIDFPPQKKPARFPHLVAAAGSGPALAVGDPADLESGWRC